MNERRRGFEAILHFLSPTIREFNVVNQATWFAGIQSGSRKGQVYLAYTYLRTGLPTPQEHVIVMNSGLVVAQILYDYDFNISQRSKEGPVRIVYIFTPH